jgi:hypothetical protein
MVLVALAASVIVPATEVPERGVVNATIGGGLRATVPVAVTATEAPPPLEPKVTLAVTMPVAAGLNRTTTAWLAPAAILNEAPDTTPKGSTLDAVPVSMPPPAFVTVKERSTDPPTVTDPKSTVVCGVTENVGGGVAGGCPAPLTAFAVAALRASISAPRSLPSVPTFL